MAPSWQDWLTGLWRWTLVPSLLVLFLSGTQTLGDENGFNAEVTGFIQVLDAADFEDHKGWHSGLFINPLNKQFLRKLTGIIENIRKHF